MVDEAPERIKQIVFHNVHPDPDDGHISLRHGFGTTSVIVQAYDADGECVWGFDLTDLDHVGIEDARGGTATFPLTVVVTAA